MIDKEEEFPIAVDWAECGVTKIKAKTIEEAIKIVEEDNLLLPKGEYIDGSFAVNRQMTEYLVREARKERQRNDKMDEKE